MVVCCATQTIRAARRCGEPCAVLGPSVETLVMLTLITALALGYCMDTVFSAVAGGILLGIACVWLLGANGRIAGISGILDGLVSPATTDRAWRASFVLGLVTAGFAWHAYAGSPGHSASAGLALPAIAGLLVGFGARLANGCTSGHGVCGLGRRSVRSLVAVAVFIAAGMATTYVVRHLIGVAS